MFYTYIFERHRHCCYAFFRMGLNGRWVHWRFPTCLQGSRRRDCLVLSRHVARSTWVTRGQVAPVSVAGWGGQWARPRFCWLSRYQPSYVGFHSMARDELASIRIGNLCNHRHSVLRSTCALSSAVSLGASESCSLMRGHGRFLGPRDLLCRRVLPARSAVAHWLCRRGGFRKGRVGARVSLQCARRSIGVERAAALHVVGAVGALRARRRLRP